MKLRGLADTVGFAHLQEQMETFIKRADQSFADTVEQKLKSAGVNSSDTWRVAVCPHDDYTYTSYMYPLALKNIKAKTVILFGVAHKARLLKLEDKIIFDSFTHWKGCYGNIQVSALREKIIAGLPQNIYEVNDEMQTIEHSVEGILPFYNTIIKKCSSFPFLFPQ